MSVSSRLATATLRAHPCGSAAQRIMAAALHAVDPFTAVTRHLRRSGDELHVGATPYDLKQVDRILLLAVGKAGLPMAHAALEALGDRVMAGLIITKEYAEGSAALPPHISLVQGGHPVPNDQSQLAGERAIALLQDARATDLVLVMLSGGGSALMTAPRVPLTLPDLQTLTTALLHAGAPITAFNALRRRCDLVKGGGLLRAAAPAPVAVLVLSDVLGDDLRTIASGPFMPLQPDEPTVDTILEGYGLATRLPPHLVAALQQIEPEAAPPNKVEHTLVANVWTVVEAAADAARAQGFATMVMAEPLAGEARLAGAELLRHWDRWAPRGPACLIAGGETTVTIKGDGRGGRNQELALACVTPLADRDLLLVALATDGSDGPTDAAGAVVSGQSQARARTLDLEAAAFLARNDAYNFFDQLDDLLKPGPTFTNVNDLTIVLSAE